MASVDVEGAFSNTPHRLIEEVWRQLGLPYGDFVRRDLRTRRYTVSTGKGCTEWASSGSGVPQGGVEGPFLYMHSHAPPDELDITGVSRAGEGTTHVTRAGVCGRCGAHGAG